MIKSFIIYNKTTGKIIKTISCEDSTVDFQYDINTEDYLEGTLENFEFYIEHNQLVEMPEKPEGYYTFDYIQKIWVPDSISQERYVKTIRNNLLQQSDWTDTVSAVERLGSSLYNQWQTYRQNLRDITTQAGYPFNVTWPEAPK